MAEPQVQKTGASAGQASTYTLFYYPFSLYSLIVRFAIELGRSIDRDVTPEVMLRLVDLQQEEHISEEFLSINGLGQVPVLAIGSSGDSAGTVHETGSRAILSRLTAIQPGLVPEDLRQVISEHLDVFYEFNAAPLSVRPEERTFGIPNRAAAHLEKGDISDDYRRLLEVKSLVHDTMYGSAMNPESIDELHLKVRNFTRRISALLHRQSEREGLYLLGSTPTILDAVAATFLAHLKDVNRTDLVEDPALWTYHGGLTETKAWTRTLQGRETIWNPSYGRAEQWVPL